MKKPETIHHGISFIALILLLMTGLASAATLTVDNFSSVADNTTLSAVTGWSTSSNASGIVSTTAGYPSGTKGALINDLSSYVLTLPSCQLLTASDGPLRFSVKFRLVTDYPYSLPQLMLLQTGGVNGLFIRFDGGTTTVSGTSVNVSTGGTSWGSATFLKVPNSNWQKNVWYQLLIDNIVLSTTGTGTSVTGTVTVTDLSTNTAIVSNQPITGVGTTGGAFSKIDLIRFQSWGANRPFDVCDVQFGTKCTLTATFGGNRPNLALFKPTETVPITFSALNANGQTLTVTTQDITGAQVSSASYTITSDNWSTTLNAYNAKLGFYRVYGRLSNGTPAIPATLSNVPTNLLAYQGPLPGKFITYAVVPDPAQRIAAIPDSQIFFGLQGCNSSASTDTMAFLGCRWTVDQTWNWRNLAPNQNQRNTFVANPVAVYSWSTNGSGQPWTVCSLPNLAGAPYTGSGGVPGVTYPGVPNVFLNYTLMTGALDPTYNGDWQAYTTHVAQNWSTVYPAQTQHYYELTWEPIPSWGYTGTPAQLVSLYQLAYTAMHTADPASLVTGPCMDIDKPGSLTAQYANFDAGLAAYLDAFSSHPYMENDSGWDTGFYEPEMAGQPANIATMKRRLRTYKGGIDIPMMGTEQGWRTRQSLGTASNQANEINQARRLVRGNLILLGEGWQRNKAFHFNDFPEADNMSGVKTWEWGMFYNLDPANNSGYTARKVMPKPVVPAYAAMTFLLEGRRAVNNVNWLGDSTRGYVYESYQNSQDDMLVLWDFVSSHSVTINAGAGVSSVDIYDWLGNKTTASTNAGNVTVTVSNEPVYIKGVASTQWGSLRTQSNLALGKTITTSGDSGTATPGSLAVDGDVWSPESRWVSTSDSNAKWLQIDLGSSCTVKEIRFFTGNYAPTSYGSNSNFYNSPFASYRLQQWNGSAWVDIVSRTGNTKAVIDEVFSPVTTAKIRLYLDAGSVTQAQLYEIQVLN